MPSFSVFTPTHDPQYLLEAYGSLLPQQVDWEWVIVPNGPCTPEQIPEPIRRDPRVRIVPWRDDEGPALGVGALKQYACLQCRNDIFVELDHDDQLLPHTLAEVGVQAAAGAGFIFSDNANFERVADADQPQYYDARHGWETYHVEYLGQQYTVQKNFPVTARSLCEIYYAPDHVRCWTRDAYFSVGGHNSALIVGDDHDLICRSYLARIPFAGTGTCGYLHRKHPTNTTQQKQLQIQTQQAANRDKYLHRLIAEECRRDGFPLLDLDIRQPAEAFIFSDDELTILAGDNSLGAIQAYDVLQYVPEARIVPFFNELYRALKPGGWLCLAAPSTDGRGAFMPYYRSWWNEYSLAFLVGPGHRQHFSDRMPNGPLEAKFQAVRVFTDYPGQPLPPPHYTYERARVSYVYADLCALKGQRQPGLVDVG